MPKTLNSILIGSLLIGGSLLSGCASHSPHGSGSTDWIFGHDDGVRTYDWDPAKGPAFYPFPEGFEYCPEFEWGQTSSAYHPESKKHKDLKAKELATKSCNIHENTLPK